MGAVCASCGEETDDLVPLIAKRDGEIHRVAMPFCDHICFNEFIRNNSQYAIDWDLLKRKDEPEKMRKDGRECAYCYKNDANIDRTIQRVLNQELISNGLCFCSEYCAEEYADNIKGIVVDQ